MKRIFWLLPTILLFTACESFEELSVDPNRSSEVNPGLLLTNIMVDAFNIPSADAALASQYLVFTDGVADEQYYGWQRAGFGRYSSLLQVAKMIQEAERIGNDNYVAIGKFFRAWHFHELTRTFGDVPYSEALKGEENGFTPAYDTQESIYAGILQELEEANGMLGELNGPVNGDFLYNGDLQQWKKLINSFRVRVLIDLSRKEGNTAIDPKGQLAKMAADPANYPVFAGNGDHAQLVYVDRDNNRYPHYNNRSLQTAYYLSSTFADLLKSYNDPRLFAYADPERRAVENGQPGYEMIAGAYGGLESGAQLTANVLAASNEGKGSPVDDRYHSVPEGEPCIALGYPELQFNLAEAVARGWISGDAKTYYENGIRASMEFYGISQARILSYLAHPQVAYDPARGIEQINIQKYLSLFMHSGWESFYNQRRTGYPEFRTGDGTQNNGLVPLRWMYPQSELDYNQAKVSEAINRQFGGNDHVNQVMWLLQ
ncbi:MAG: SusD/RagB family nutrient-binding outer membrane lipoprotein [Saprospiraceae bacterium]